MNKTKEENKKKISLLKIPRKPIKLGKVLEGKASKEFIDFLAFSRASVDRTFMSSVQNPEKGSIGLEKSFELLLKDQEKIEPISFFLGLTFGLSRWNFLIARLQDNLKEKRDPDSYIV